MKQFSIASLERFADIKAHTFRVWEQRYNFLKPQRTETNHRYYTISDLKQLLNIALLSKSGYKISKLDKLDSGTIMKIVEDLNDDVSRKSREMNLLIVSMYSANIEVFEEILDKCVYYWGIDSTIEDIIVPFLNLVKLSSYNDTSNEVHFVVTALRKKLILGIESAKPVVKLEQKALLFLPQNEHFDLVLLYMCYISKRAGYKTLYMGTNIPMQNLEKVIVEKKPEVVLTYLTPKIFFQIEKFADYVQHTLPSSILIYSGVIGKSYENINRSNAKFLEHQVMKAYLTDKVQ